MQLTITERALEKLYQLKGDKHILLALVYDTDDCGCGVNGVPAIQLIKEVSAKQEPIVCDQAKVVIQQQQAVFFNKEMKLDYNGATFRLSSPEEMLNPFIHVQAV
ncbi:MULTISPECIES: iron-sulfur cluster biosynthesis family protein [Gracilibacillus]|uniref:iron-sulfur cluster biosynthesis family protein n=1 Tax=Gracilibacillus TaxID=74385 RepID=UPI0008263051|nr:MULTISPECIES: iron-sulfur cluster biosynthesis family protein [Gracilibacillus]